MIETEKKSKRIRVEVYSKPGCHLCDEAKEALEAVKRDFNIDIHEINIEENRELFDKYQYDIPVIWINGRKAFKHKMDVDQLRAKLEKESTTAP